MTPKYAEHFKFKALVGVVETYGGTYGNEPGLIKAQLTTQRVVVADLNNPNLAKLAKALEVRCEEYFSCMILQGSDNIGFYQLKIDLANSMTVKKETQHLINDYKVPPRQLRLRGSDSDRVTFVRDG